LPANHKCWLDIGKYWQAEAYAVLKRKAPNGVHITLGQEMMQNQTIEIELPGEISSLDQDIRSSK
jgi:hypothetical protein